MGIPAILTNVENPYTLISLEFWFESDQGITHYPLFSVWKFIGNNNTYSIPIHQFVGVVII